MDPHIHDKYDNFSSYWIQLFYNHYFWHGYCLLCLFVCTVQVLNQLEEQRARNYDHLIELQQGNTEELSTLKESLKKKDTQLLMKQQELREKDTYIRKLEELIQQQQQQLVQSGIATNMSTLGTLRRKAMESTPSTPIGNSSSSNNNNNLSNYNAIGSSSSGNIGPHLARTLSVRSIGEQQRDQQQQQQEKSKSIVFDMKLANWMDHSSKVISSSHLVLSYPIHSISGLIHLLYFD